MLGAFYYIYMSLLSTFCTNSINILAGINGIETSQTLVIASSIVINDLLYLPLPVAFDFHSLHVGGVYGAGMAWGSKEMVDRHLLSLYFMLPLIGVCVGLLSHNW
jgi:UDP-N-acetylglucosamine--dolichyl-phosphate N-acetylglucosaminephosphotransferase